MSDTPRTSPCPACKAPAPHDGAHRPFCSKRCKLVDLAKWLGGEYAIPSDEPADPHGLDDGPDTG